MELYIVYNPYKCPKNELGNSKKSHHWTDPEQTWVSNSSIATYKTGSVGIRSHSSFDGYLPTFPIKIKDAMGYITPLICPKMNWVTQRSSWLTGLGCPTRLVDPPKATFPTICPRCRQRKSPLHRGLHPLRLGRWELFRWWQWGAFRGSSHLVSTRTPKPWKMKVLHPKFLGYNP